MRRNRQSTDVSASVEAFFFWSWVVVLCWAPIPLGSNRPFAWAILEVAVFGLGLLWLIAWGFGRVKTTEPFQNARWFLLLLGLWLAYQALYVIPMPLDWIERLSPAAASMHRLSLGLPSSEPYRTLSIDPSASQVMLLKGLLFVLTFIGTLLVVTTRARAAQLATTLVYFAFVVGVCAIIAHYTNLQHSWFGQALQHGNRAIGPFVNPNHFACYIAMSLSMGIGLLIAELRDTKTESWRDFVKHGLEWFFSSAMRMRLTLCVMVIALVTTRSRMGNTAFFSALLIAGAIGIALSRRATRGTVVLLTSLLVIDLFIVGSYFGVEKLANRIEQTALLNENRGSEETYEDRSAAARYALKIVDDYPVFGSGPGTLYVTFPSYRQRDIVHFYDFLHIDYIQLATENGYVGVGILGIMVLWCLVVAMRAQFMRRDPLMRGLAFGSLMGTAVVLVHSNADFNLYIPSNAMLLMVLLAFAWIALHLERRQVAGVVGTDGR